MKKKPVVLALRCRTAPAEICSTIKNKIKHWLNCSTVANDNKEKICDYPFTLKRLTGSKRLIDLLLLL